MQKIVSYTYIKGNIVLNVPHEKGEKLLFASIFHFLFNRLQSRGKSLRRFSGWNYTAKTSETCDTEIHKISDI